MKIFTKIVLYILYFCALTGTIHFGIINEWAGALFSLFITMSFAAYIQDKEKNFRYCLHYHTPIKDDENIEGFRSVVAKNLVEAFDEFDKYAQENIPNVAIIDFVYREETND